MAAARLLRILKPVQDAPVDSLYYISKPKYGRAHGGLVRSTLGSICLKSIASLVRNWAFSCAYLLLDEYPTGVDRIFNRGASRFIEVRAM